MSKQIIAVVGGTGAQGGGVVEALLERGRFAIRVLTRNPEGERAKAFAERGVEIVKADLNAPETLSAAFSGAYGAFVVTNFWDPATGGNEYEQGKAAVRAAKEAGVEHYVWSTLPNSKEISGGKLAVEHFTSKALVDPEVTAADFHHHTFMEPPMYFQNLTGPLAPQPIEGGAKGWALPIDPDKRNIHAGDISEFGKVVARVFEQPGRVGQGQHLAVASEMLSWSDLVETLNAQGHDLRVVQVPAQAYDGFYPGASEMREMFQWFEGYTYFGPDAEEKIALANQVYPDGFTPFATWAAEHMTA